MGLGEACPTTKKEFCRIMEFLQTPQRGRDHQILFQYPFRQLGSAFSDKGENQITLALADFFHSGPTELRQLDSG